MKKPIALTFWDRVRWPHVAIFAICVLGAVGFAIFAPDARWSVAERIVVGLFGGGGALGWLVNGGMLRKPEEIAPPAEIPPRSPRRIDREDGSVDGYALLMVAAVAVGVLQTLRLAWPWVSRLFVVLAIVVPLSGCGATGSAVAGVATAASMVKPIIGASCDVSRWYVEHVCDVVDPVETTESAGGEAPK